MIRTLLRLVRCTERLRGPSGKRWFSSPPVLSAHWQAAPSWRRAPGEQKAALRPRRVLAVPRKTVCAQGRGARGAEEGRGQQVSVRRAQGEEATISTSQKVKEAGRDLTYLVVVLIGVSITGGLFYTIFKELFSSSSPNKIYGKALDICRSHPEVISIFGEPVKGFGETTRRGRRQHVSFLEYSKDGLKHMRIKFYIQGSEPGRQGTVHLEVKENPESGEYEFRYIFVEVDSYPGRTIVIEDNRS